MSRNDLSVHGVQGTLRVRQAAAATRVEAGEPMHSINSYTTGTSDLNVYILAVTDTPVIGTDKLGGVANKGSNPFSTGTIVVSEISLARPIPQVGVLRGNAETAGNIDTDAELLAILQDVVLIDVDTSGAPDGGELFTIKDTATADTSGLEIVDGNIAKGTLDTIVDNRAYRTDVST